MPDDDALGHDSDALVTRAIAQADPLERTRFIKQLAGIVQSADEVASLGDRLTREGTIGRSIFLEWIGHLRGSLTRTLTDRILLCLRDDDTPTSVRILAAARLLQILPDRLESIRQVIRPLTATLSPLARLERLRQLQHQLDRSDALDALIAKRERRLKIDCPRCGVRLPIVEMIVHLWNVHALTLERGRVRGLARTVEELQDVHRNSHDTTILDRAGLLAGERELRAWTATSDYSPDDIAPLLTTAIERDAGLCPGCLAELPPGVPPLPPPAIVANGRLAGDGFRVEVGGAEWLRTLTVSEPGRVIRSGLDRQSGLGRRGAATLAAATILLATLAMAIFFPRTMVSPTILASRMIMLAALLYLTLWLIRPRFADANHRAIDAAWTYFGRWPAADSVRFVTRLCRASFGRGDPLVRLAPLNNVIETYESSSSSEHQGLAAAAELLKVEDEALIGRDRVSGVVDLVAESFRGERTALFAEYVCACFIEREPPPPSGELARLRMLLIAAAFDAGLRPQDLIDLWKVAPSLRRAMSIEPHHRLGLLLAIWSNRQLRSWERIARAETVFELCHHAPNISGRLLQEHPDLLLYHRPKGLIEEVLIGTRGVSFGGVTVSDPTAEIALIDRQGGHFLIFGTNRLPVPNMPDDFVDILKGWLRYRFKVLLPQIDRYQERGNLDLANSLRRPLSTQCPHCGTISAIEIGKVGLG